MYVHQRRCGGPHGAFGIYGCFFFLLANKKREDNNDTWAHRPLPIDTPSAKQVGATWWKLALFTSTDRSKHTLDAGFGEKIKTSWVATNYPNSRNFNFTAQGTHKAMVTEAAATAAAAAATPLLRLT